MRTIPAILLAILIAAGGRANAFESDRNGIAAGEVVSPEVLSGQVFQGSGMTLEQAVAQVRSQYNGRIVSAETRVSGGQETHVIKVLTSDGKVKTVRIPGRRR
jgi:hypothetical protein